MRFSLFACACYAVMMIASAGCGREKNELVHDHAHEHEHESEHEHHHDHEGHDHGSGQEITLEPAQAQSMGVATEVIEPGDFEDAILVTGRISGSQQNVGAISAPTSGIFTFSSDFSVGSHISAGQTIGKVDARNVSGGDTNAAALAALNNAKRELDRLTPLYEKQLVTARQYNDALAAYEAAKAAYSPKAASGLVTAPISGVITEIPVSQGQFVEAGTIIARLSDGSKLTLIADLPDRYATMAKSLGGATVIPNGSTEGIDISATPTVPMMSTTPGYIPVVYTFENDGRLIPGAVVEVYLKSKTRENIISVPLSAITEQQGNYFVFIKVDEEGYIKSPVRLGNRNGNSIEILSGVHQGDEIVVKGVTALRLAETSGAVPEGHTHSH